jgi:hypothetical protein
LQFLENHHCVSSNKTELFDRDTELEEVQTDGQKEQQTVA